jgi:uracil-DNA glycosylase
VNKLDSLLDQARTGNLLHCTDCVWNPRRVGRMAFGTSCPDHSHVDDTPALVVCVARDPGRTTPEHTGRLCIVCNSRNPSDRSAGHAFDLWRAVVSMAPRSDPYSDPYLKRTYFTNAIMHGVPSGRPKDEEARLSSLLSQARGACAGLLSEQLRLLRPRVVLLSGEDSAAAFRRIAPVQWSEATGVRPSEGTITVPGMDHPVRVLKAYHTSARATNQAAAPKARRFFPSIVEQEAAVRAEIEQLPSQKEALTLLEKYRTNGGTDTVFRGMMLHLAWWIQVGKAIRAAAGT